MYPKTPVEVEGGFYVTGVMGSSLHTKNREQPESASHLHHFGTPETT